MMFQLVWQEKNAAGIAESRYLLYKKPTWQKKMRQVLQIRGTYL